MNTLLQAFLPNYCLHCREEWPKGEWPLCDDCQTLLGNPVDPKNRCPLCFSEHYSKKRKQCSDCQTRESPYEQMAAVHDYIGPPKTLIDRLRREKNERLAKYLTALMVVQSDRLGWPVPDLVSSVPSHFNRRFLRGFEAAALLAKEYAKWFKIPYIPLLERTAGEFPQTSFPSTERKSPKNDLFCPKKGVSIVDKTVVLIDDFTITGATLISAGQTLLKMNPNKLIAFSFCKF